MDRTLSSSTTPSLQGPGSDGDVGVVRIPQTFAVTEASPSDCLQSYRDTRWGKSYHSAAIKSVYLTALADRARKVFS